MQGFGNGKQSAAGGLGQVLKSFGNSSRSAAAIGQRQGPTMAIDAYNRWNSPGNPLRGVIDPISIIRKAR
jgi:hypothetical protein